MNIYSIAFTLLLVLDPFGNVPLFITILSKIEAKKRRWIIVREMLIALLILFFFLFFGDLILKGMKISRAALSISGGVILFLIALKMIFPGKLISSEEEEQSNPLIVPLAVPLVAGPSSISMIILFTQQKIVNTYKLIFCLLIAWFISLIILYFSDYLNRFFGFRVLKAIERLMGLILTTIAIQMLLTGIEMINLP